MKTFINVLYRKILYKIPLKFLLLILVIVGVLYYNYSSADSFNGAISYWVDLPANSQIQFSTSLGDFICISTSEAACTDLTLTLGNITNRGNSFQKLLCVFGQLNNRAVVVNNNTDNSCPFYFIRGFKSDFEANLCSVMSSLECQTEYNLIPISSVDQNYCITNNLCPSCPSCPSGGSGRSNVYINDILHVGAPNIVMNIAEEIDWDYEYTAGGNNMNIDVVGYNVDYEKIGEIIDNQNYKPSSEDFKNILGILAPYTKIIVFFVFLFLVWAWIKKPFKSKKL